jgi:hypothetical protein
MTKIRELAPLARLLLVIMVFLIIMAYAIFHIRPAAAQGGILMEHDIARFTEECQYMHDTLGDQTSMDVCVHVLSFRMAHIEDIYNNAHAGKK